MHVSPYYVMIRYESCCNTQIQHIAPIFYICVEHRIHHDNGQFTVLCRTLKITRKLLEKPHRYSAYPIQEELFVQEHLSGDFRIKS
jgi:hypothetical protein